MSVDTHKENPICIRHPRVKHFKLVMHILKYGNSFLFEINKKNISQECHKIKGVYNFREI